MLTTMLNLTEHRPGLGESHHYSQCMRDIRASFCTLGPGIKTACLAATPSLSEVMYEHNVSLAIYPMPTLHLKCDRILLGATEALSTLSWPKN